MINRELIIIPIEGESSEKYLKTAVDLENRHVKELKEYITNNNIKININDTNSIYVLSVEMAMNNYVVVCTDDLYINIYLPVDLSENQSKWFNDYKSAVTRLRISAASLVKDGKEIGIDLIEPDDTRRSPITRLYKEIKKKTIKEEAKKVMINENKRRSY